MLSRRIYVGGRQFESVVALNRQDKTEWGKVEDQLRHDLVASLPKRCSAALKAASNSKK